MATIVLYNKLAGNGTGEQKAQKVKEVWKDRELTFRSVTDIEDYAAFFAGLDAKDTILICGGDGTLNRFINDTDGLTVSQDIFFYPSGTGNDFWRDIGKTAEDGPARINDYLKDLPLVEVNGKTYRFLNGIGYGIDGYCCEVGDQLRAKSDKPINYTSIAIKGLLFHYKPTNATVTVDGLVHKFEKAWLAPTMHGRFYGGGMMAAPDQKRNNPKHTVSVMVMNGAGRLHTLAVFPTIFKGEHVKHDKLVTVLTGNEVTVSFDRPVALQVDGETILNVSSYHVTTK